MFKKKTYKINKENIDHFDLFYSHCKKKRELDAILLIQEHFEDFKNPLFAFFALKHNCENVLRFLVKKGINPWEIFDIKDNSHKITHLPLFEFAIIKGFSSFIIDIIF